MGCSRCRHKVLNKEERTSTLSALVSDFSKAIVTLAAADHQTSSQAANFIASIAAIELPRNEWPELMQTLVEGVQTGTKPLKLGSYKAIEYICETVVRPPLLIPLNG